jgi:hypothetical protein
MTPKEIAEANAVSLSGLRDRHRLQMPVIIGTIITIITDGRTVAPTATGGVERRA